MPVHGFKKGLHEIAEGTFAYLQPNGQWGLSNAGLVVDHDQSLLIDTLFDRAHTQEMLDAMRRRSPAAATIDTVVNTHANGDHCWGNELVREARIIASEACKKEMASFPPARLALLMRVAGLAARLGPAGSGLARILSAAGLTKVAQLLEAGPWVSEIFREFEFRGIELVLPTDTFEDRTTLTVGDTRVDLIEVGPAHTAGDVIVYVPNRRVVFTGDILFSKAHPIIWEGPSGNWIAACERICELDVDVVVPGHGPITDKAAVARTSRYLVYLREEAKKRLDAGMTPELAARDIDLSEFADWTERERVVANVTALFRELRGNARADDTIELFAAMARARQASSF